MSEALMLPLDAHTMNCPGNGDMLLADDDACTCGLKWRRRIYALESAILAIDAKAAPYGSPLIENGEEYVQAYIMPAGPLHRALGLVGRSAAKDWQGRSPDWKGETKP